MTTKFHQVEARRNASLASALEMAAKDLEASAARLRRKAELAAHSASRHEEWAELPAIMREIERDIVAGKSEDEAIERAVDGWYFVNFKEPKNAREREVKAMHFRVHFRDHMARSTEVRRFHRNRIILQLARTHSNAEIGARFGLHPGSVSRIVQEALRRARNPAPLARADRHAHNLPTRQRAALSHQNGENP